MKFKVQRVEAILGGGLVVAFATEGIVRWVFNVTDYTALGVIPLTAVAVWYGLMRLVFGDQNVIEVNTRKSHK